MVIFYCPMTVLKLFNTLLFFFLVLLYPITFYSALIYFMTFLLNAVNCPCVLSYLILARQTNLPYNLGCIAPEFYWTLQQERMIKLQCTFPFLQESAIQFYSEGREDILIWIIYNWILPGNVCRKRKRVIWQKTVTHNSA